MQYYEQVKHNNMEKGECSGEPLYVCSEPFSMRHYVLLSRQKNMFQNWPFAEKYLRLCLKYGVTNMLPPLESRDSTMDISMINKGKVKIAGDNDHNFQKASFAATISMVCEQVQLMSLCYEDHNQEKEIPSDICYPEIKNTNIASVNTIARKREKSRRWRRKYKSMADIYATAKHRTLEEVEEISYLSCSSEIDLDTGRQMQKIDQVDSEYYGDYYESELTDDGEDHSNGLFKRRRVLKSWRISSSPSHEALDPSQIEQVQPSISSTSTITTTESSIQGLVKLWRRRQNYQQNGFKSSTNHDPNNNSVAPWRFHLVDLLECPQAHIFVIFLLVCDLAISIIELSSSLTPNSCKNVDGKLEAWYHWVGVTILGLLLSKTMLLGLGFGRSFFKKPGYVVDGVIVGVALVLEVVLERVGGGLLVVVSLWRVVRAVESVFELSDDAIQAKIEAVVCEFNTLREENKRLSETIAEEEKIILRLQEQLGACPT